MILHKKIIDKTYTFYAKLNIIVPMFGVNAANDPILSMMCLCTQNI